MAFPWLPLLTAGLGIAGSFMGQQTGTNQNSNQVTDSTTNTEGTSNTTTAQTAQSQTNQQVQQTGTQNTSQNQDSTSNREGEISRLDDETLGMLRDQVQNLLSGTQTTRNALNEQLAEVSALDGNFDADSFVNGIVAQASSVIGSDLESGTNAVQSRSGGGVDSNSASALLAGKLRNQAAANLAGVSANARATAAEIQTKTRESKTAQIGSLAGGLDSGTSNLLNSLLQASQKENTSEVDNTASTGTSTSSANTNTAETSKQNTLNSSTNVQSGKQVTNTKQTGNVNQSEQSNDWTKLFSGLADIFSTEF